MRPLPTRRFAPPITAMFALAYLLAALLAAPAARAFDTGYMPLTAAELSRRIELKQIPLAGVPGVTKDGDVTIETGLGDDHNVIIFSGRDKAGKPWTAWSNLGPTDSRALYSIDVARDGAHGLIFIDGSGANGWGPSTNILMLTFDSAGRPMPTSFAGYDAFDATSIDHLIDFVGDGRPAFVLQSFDDGYWVTSLYVLDKGRWSLAHGRYGGRSFPLYTRFTNRPNTKPTTPSRGRHPREGDYSTGDFGPAGLRIADLHWSDEDGAMSLGLSDGRKCSAGFVIVDTDEGRQIALGVSAEVRRLLAEAKTKSMDVTTVGKTVWPDVPQPACAPDSIWARQTVADKRPADR
jgi:hypothetical protein